MKIMLGCLHSLDGTNDQNTFNHRTQDRIVTFMTLHTKELRATRTF